MAEQAAVVSTEAYVEYGGPDGGDGGRGGHVIAECVDGLNTLIDYRYKQHFKAKTVTLVLAGKNLELQERT